MHAQVETERLGLLELHPVAERVVRMEPPDARDLPVRADTGVPGGSQHREKPVQVIDEQRRVRLTSGRERLLNPEVQDRASPTRTSTRP